MKRRHIFPILLTLVAAVILPVSCQSTPEEIPPDLSRMEMFQRAQEASDDGRYELALRYYREFIDRFPDDRGSIIEAQYEIAFIAYKQEQFDTAEERFRAILASYTADEGGSLPEWPRVLSEKLLEIIDERRREEGLFDATGDADDAAQSEEAAPGNGDAGESAPST